MTRRGRLRREYFGPKEGGWRRLVFGWAPLGFAGLCALVGLSAFVDYGMRGCWSGPDETIGQCLDARLTALWAFGGCVVLAGGPGLARKFCDA